MRPNGEISLEQLYKMLRISKRKAAWMLQNGIIPCQIRATATHRYVIRIEDVEAYLARSRVARRKEIPVGLFNAKPRKSPLPNEPRDSDGRGYIPESVLSLRGKKRERFKELLEDALAHLPDSLTIDEAAEAIGYSRNMVLSHVQKKHIYAVKVSGRWVVAKSGLVAFLATDRAFRIREKSRWHEGMVRRFVGMRSIKHHP